MSVQRPRFKFARRIRVLWTFFWFGAYVVIDSRRLAGTHTLGRDAMMRRQASRLRERLISLGPTFIKSGQMLATRADLLPIEYVDELTLLQDSVPAFPNQQAKRLIEAELGRPITEVFARMSEDPIASASLGQVYSATLITGEEVAVKVQRPGLEEAIRLDLDLLRWLGRFMSRHPKFFPGTDWLGAIDEFDRVVHEEMDYRREAASADEFRHNFRDWGGIHVPRIFHAFSTTRLLVLEFVTGTKVTDLVGLRAAGHDPRKVNELIYRAYFKQLLEDGLFHADPHPGNLLVMADGRLAVFDFGMMGRISAQLQRQIIDAFFHLYNRDVNAIVDDLIGLGFLAPEADQVALRRIVSDVFARKLNLKIGEVRFKDLTYDLAPVIYQHPITTPAHFTYLMRALMTLEGVSIVMNPEFNFFDVAKPYVKEFLLKRESAELRRMVVDSMRDAKTGRFEWGRLWTMAKMAYSLYLGN